MHSNGILGTTVPFSVVKTAEGGTFVTVLVEVASEVPFTIIANDTELVTLSCLPSNIKEFVYGFLFTSAIISQVTDVTSYWLDTSKWRCEVTLKTMPDPLHFSKRLYTSGCGRGVLFATVADIANRKRSLWEHSIDVGSLLAATRYLQSASSIHATSGGVHTAALGFGKELPRIVYDDIGRHNAVDKVIGKALLEGCDLNSSILYSTGRISSDILHKAKRADIGIIVSLGSPTHQVVLTAREFGMTIVGFARGKNLTIYSCPERITA